MKLKGKTIILGVTGGIAAYKSADLVSRLKKLGANVEVIMTNAATEFVNPLTFQTMSNNPVHISMFNKIEKFDVEHISLAKKADLVVVAPATANTIGKIANGIADNLLTTVIMATKKKVAFAPAMNTGMYDNDLYQENMQKLKALGYDFISPSDGRLACGDVGKGKMAEPVEIVEYIQDYFVEKDMVGKKVLVTAGPTIEALDPVRYLTNHSSGKMGYALAKAAKTRGAEVVLVSGPTDLLPAKGVVLEKVESTRDMYKLVDKYFDNIDILIKAAAPADYRPKVRHDKKIKKEISSSSYNVEFVRNPDILNIFGNKKSHQKVVGFAAETDNVINNAKSKLKKKNLDFIVVNDITQLGAGFRGDTNVVSIIDRHENVESYPKMTKEDLANIILDRLNN